ncbi:MAG: hypothetical protein AABY01_01860, partial [Nanoarchaeota archaeon]
MTSELSIDTFVEELFTRHRRDLLVEHRRNPWKVSFWRLHENESYQGLVKLGSKAFPYFRFALEQQGPDALFLAAAVVTIVQGDAQLRVSTEALKYQQAERAVEYALGLMNEF